MNNLKPKILSVISLLFLIFALYIIAVSPPVTGYELSIYSSVNPLMWIFLFISSISGMSIIVYKAFTRSKGNFWLIGFFVMMLNNFIIFSLQSFRGYLHYSSNDHILHLRIIKNLIEFGHFEDTNPYPIIHILVSQISQICSIEPNIIAQYLPAFLSIFFLMLIMYLLAKYSVFEKGQVLLSCAASSIMYFNVGHIQLYPHMFSILLFPFLIYLYFKSIEKNTWQIKLQFIVLLILLPFTHPSGFVTFIPLLIAMELARVAYHKRYVSKYSLSENAVKPILISIIIFFMWASSFWFFAKISLFWDSIFEPFKNPNFLQVIQITLRLRWIEVVEYNLKMFGDNLIYIMLSLIAGKMIIQRILKKEKDTKYLFLLFIFFLICMPIEYILLMGVGSETVGRALNLLYMMTVTPVLVGFVLYELFKNKKRTLSVITILIILASTWVISIFSVYHSPWTFSPSWHITNMDVKGSNWFLAHRDSSLDFDAMGIETSLILGKIGLVPSHFNYTQNNKFGESLAHDIYVLINKRCKLSNTDPMLAKAKLNMVSGWGFDEKDFDQFEADLTVTKIYSNGEFDAFLIYSKAR